MYFADRDPTVEEKRAGTGGADGFREGLPEPWNSFDSGLFATGEGARGAVQWGSAGPPGQSPAAQGYQHDRRSKCLSCPRSSKASTNASSARPPAKWTATASALARAFSTKSFAARSSAPCRNDWTISYEGKTYQIQDNTCRPRNKVTVRCRYDGSMAILRNEQPLRFRLAPT